MMPVVAFVACGAFFLTGVLAILIDRHTRALIAVRCALEAIADAEPVLIGALDSAIAELNRAMKWSR